MIRIDEALGDPLSRCNCKMQFSTWRHFEFLFTAISTFFFFFIYSSTFFGKFSPEEVGDAGEVDEKEIRLHCHVLKQYWIITKALNFCVTFWFLFRHKRKKKSNFRSLKTSVERLTCDFHNKKWIQGRPKYRIVLCVDDTNSRQGCAKRGVSKFHVRETDSVRFSGICELKLASLGKLSDKIQRMKWAPLRRLRGWQENKTRVKCPLGFIKWWSYQLAEEDQITRWNYHNLNWMKLSYLVCSLPHLCALYLDVMLSSASLSLSVAFTFHNEFQAT